MNIVKFLKIIPKKDYGKVFVLNLKNMPLSAIILSCDFHIIYLKDL